MSSDILLVCAKRGAIYWFVVSPQKKYERKDFIRAVEDKYRITYEEAAKIVDSIQDKCTTQTSTNMKLYKKLKDFILAMVERGELKYNGLGQLQSVEGRSQLATIGPIIEDYNQEVRELGKEFSQYVLTVKDNLVGDLITMIGDNLRSVEKESLCKKLQYTPSADGGLLRKMWEPVLDHTHEVELNAYLDGIYHWMWVVKRRFLYALPTYYPFMLCLFGIQNTGKSTILEKFIEPFGDFSKGNMSIPEFTDSRNFAVLTARAIIPIEELAGAGKTDVDTFKAIVTGKHRTNRPLNKNVQITSQILTSLIGSTNKHLRDVIYDPTGMRRYFEIPLKRKVIDESHVRWMEENALTIWRSVNENAESVIHMREYPDRFSAVQKVQQLQERKEIATLFLEEKDYIPEDGFPVVAVKIQRLYVEFRAWSKTTGAHDPGKDAFARMISYRLPFCPGKGEELVVVKHSKNVKEDMVVKTEDVDLAEPII